MDAQTYLSLLRSDGIRQIRKKKYTKLSKMYHNLHQIDNFDIESLKQKSICQENLQKYSSGLKTVLKIFNFKEVQSSFLYFIIGNFYQNLEFLEKALFYYQKSLQISPQNYKSLIYKAQILYIQQKYEESENILQSFMQNILQFSQSLQIFIYSLLLKIEIKRKNYQKSSEIINILLEFNQNDLFALIYQSFVYLETHQYEEEAQFNLIQCKKKIFLDRNSYTKQTFYELIEIINNYIIE